MYTCVLTTTACVCPVHSHPVQVPPSSFAARLDAIRSIWSNDPDEFSFLMSGDVRIPCSLNSSSSDKQKQGSVFNTTSTSSTAAVAGSSSPQFIKNFSPSLDIPNSAGVVPTTATCLTDTRIGNENNNEDQREQQKHQSDVPFSLGLYPDWLWNGDHLSLVQQPSPVVTAASSCEKNLATTLDRKAASRSEIQKGRPSNVLWGTLLPQQLDHIQTPNVVSPLNRTVSLPFQSLHVNPSLKGRSLKLLSLWWIGLPPSLRPLLWMLSVCGGPFLPSKDDDCLLSKSKYLGKG